MMQLLMQAAETDVMDGIPWGGIALVLTALLGSGGIGIFVQKRTPKFDRQETMLNRYDNRMEKLEKRVDDLEDELALSGHYVDSLRQHIISGSPPPPPEPPAGLYGAR